MIEEPYRWVEAIANRREYIDTELATGSPIIGISFADGILLLTFSRDRRKIFEIYDRIALGGIGHPGDIERLRMLAIELASTEGFTRSAADVSLRRMTSYSFSPALKEAFEQVYGAPYLVRLLFAEVGNEPSEDFLLRIDYDGSTHGNAKAGGVRREIARRQGRRAGHEIELPLGTLHVNNAGADGQIRTNQAPSIAETHQHIANDAGLRRTARFLVEACALRPDAARDECQVVGVPDVVTLDAHVVSQVTSKEEVHGWAVFRLVKRDLRCG